MESIHTVDDPMQQDAIPQFNIIETDIASEIVDKFCADVLAHIFTYRKDIGTIELNSERNAILMSKKINIVEYMVKHFNWVDVYDVDCIGIKIKKITDVIKRKAKLWLTHDDNYYTSKYLYIATPNSLCEAYLLAIIGKKNVLMSERLETMNGVISENASQLQNLIQEVSDQVETVNSNVIAVQEELTSKIEEANKQLAETARILEAKSHELKLDINASVKRINELASSLTKVERSFDDKLTELSESFDGQRDDIKKTFAEHAQLTAVVVADLDSFSRIHTEDVKTIKGQIENNNGEVSTKLSALDSKYMQLITDLTDRLSAKIDDKLDNLSSTINEKLVQVNNDVTKQIALIKSNVEELSFAILPADQGYVVMH
jgi:hypothetical protein